MAYLAHILDDFGAISCLEGFACTFGRQFYGLQKPANERRVVLVKEPFSIPLAFEYVDQDNQASSIVPFMAGKMLQWKLSETAL